MLKECFCCQFFPFLFFFLDFLDFFFFFVVFFSLFDKHSNQFGLPTVSCIGRLVGQELLDIDLANLGPLLLDLRHGDDEDTILHLGGDAGPVNLLGPLRTLGG